MNTTRSCMVLVILCGAMFGGAMFGEEGIVMPQHYVDMSAMQLAGRSTTYYEDLCRDVLRELDVEQGAVTVLLWAGKVDFGGRIPTTYVEAIVGVGVGQADHRLVFVRQELGARSRNAWHRPAFFADIAALDEKPTADEVIDYVRGTSFAYGEFQEERQTTCVVGYITFTDEERGALLAPLPEEELARRRRIFTQAISDPIE